MFAWVEWLVWSNHQDRSTTHCWWLSEGKRSNFVNKKDHTLAGADKISVDPTMLYHIIYHLYLKFRAVCKIRKIIPLDKWMAEWNWSTTIYKRKNSTQPQTPNPSSYNFPLHWHDMDLLAGFPDIFWKVKKKFMKVTFRFSDIKMKTYSIESSF